MESHCPFCMIELAENFKPAQENGLTEIADLNFVAWGNAKETGKDSNGLYTFECQHGPEECYGNALYNCTFNYAKDHLNALKTITCAAEKMNKAGGPEGTLKIEDAVKGCTKDFGINFDEVNKCAEGKEGNELSHNAMLATPEHKGVPWFLQNGEHPNEDVEEKFYSEKL